MQDYNESPEYELLNQYAIREVHQYTCCPEPYPSISIYLHLKRKPNIHTYLIVLPSMVFSMLTLLVFWLPTNSVARFIVAGVGIIVCAIMLIYLGMTAGFGNNSSPYASKEHHTP